MKRFAVLWALAALTAPLWAADVAVDGGTAPGAGWQGPGGSNYGPTTELTWDNGTRMWSIAWFTGSNAWEGNDFSVTTLKTVYTKILKYKTYSRNDWPNQTWDGFRIAFYNFGGGVPGSRIWPTSGAGYFFKPSGLNGHVWVECDINWTTTKTSFVAAQEQIYEITGCDPFSVDNNTVFRDHSWIYFNGVWMKANASNLSTAPYYNLMIRVWVETGVQMPAVEPSSIGRVKALYY